MAAEDAAEDIQDITEQPEGDGEGEGQEEPKPKSKLPLIIGGIVGLFLLCAAGAYFMGVFGGGEEKPGAQAQEEKLLATDITYYDFPQILVNLNEPGRKGKFLKLTIVFELGSPDDVPLIEKLEPRIIDQFQMYLRELRFEDLQGSEGVHRLREELLRRVNSEAGKDKVKDILFKNILVQ